MAIDSATAGAAVILFFATFGMLYGILYILQPSSMMNKKTKKFIVWKAMIVSGLFSAVFSYVVANISVQVDKQFARKQRALAAAGAAAK